MQSDADLYDRLVREGISLDAHEFRQQYYAAFALALTYREMLGMVLDAWALDVKRLQGAHERLQQVMGMTPWQ